MTVDLRFPPVTANPYPPPMARQWGSLVLQAFSPRKGEGAQHEGWDPYPPPMARRAFSPRKGEEGPQHEGWDPHLPSSASALLFAAGWA